MKEMADSLNRPIPSMTKVKEAEERNLLLFARIAVVVDLLLIRILNVLYHWRAQRFCTIA
jgi:hypothetical protein